MLLLLLLPFQVSLGEQDAEPSSPTRALGPSRVRVRLEESVTEHQAPSTDSQRVQRPTRARIVSENREMKVLTELIAVHDIRVEAWRYSVALLCCSSHRSYINLYIVTRSLHFPRVVNVAYHCTDVENIYFYSNFSD